MSDEAYYELWFDDHNADAMICEDEDLHGVHRALIFHTEPISDWPEGVTFYAAGKFREDYLFSTLPGWILVSQKVRHALETLEVKGIEFLAVRVVRRGLGEDLTDYAALHILKTLPALDSEHAVLVDKPEPGRRRIRTLALRRAAIGDADIFRLAEDPGTMCVSARVKQTLEELGATGFEWHPVPSY